jgi:membrane fusion protein, copper/silver efflux system
MIQRPWSTFVLAALLGAAAISYVFAAEPANHDHATAAAKRVYQCPMHPWIKSDRPGKCTICGMELVAADAAATAAPEGVVSLTASQITTVGVATTRVSRQPLARTLRVAGRIDDDDTRHRILAARVPGRVEKLFVTFAGQRVEADAPLVTIYSTEMLTAQRVFVERLKSGEGATSAADRSAARERLLELGLTEADIAQLEHTLQPGALLTVRAPMSGTVVTKLVYEGQYVQTSDRLFEIADFSRMWFVFDAYEQDMPWIRVGQPVNITTRAFPGEVITAPIDFIDPNFNETTRTTKVRAVIPNPHAGLGGEMHTLPHRVLAEGRVEVDASTVLAAPRSAVLDIGQGSVAYVDLGNRTFEQRKLQLGRRGDNLVEILAGLNEGDLVVTNGALLVDAQAQLAQEASSHTRTEPDVGRVASPASAAAMRGEGTPPTLNPPTSNPSPKSTVPPIPSEPFAQLAAAAIDAAEALAADDFVHYQKLFPAMAAASKTFPSLPGLELGTDLKSARRSFEPWSTAVADLLKPHRDHLGLKIFQCPMSPVSHQGRWVQRGQPLKNPFFGSTMADCGEEVR